MIELVENRQENSKTFDSGNGKRQWRGSIGAIHYKDNYASDEQWKDIDLTWEGNRITKAPYELTREGNKLTIRDKKTGEVSTIELLEDASPDVDIEVVPEFSRVRFVRILKSDKAPMKAKFRVTGNFIVRASDEDGELPVESTIKDGILTETLKPNRPIKYPVRIDPTWQPGENTDTVSRYLATDSWDVDPLNPRAGATDIDSGIGMGTRFVNVTIPQAAIISTAKLTITNQYGVDTGTVCNTRISAEDVNDAVTFADDRTAFDARWAARTTARVDWNAIPIWDVADAEHDSPEIKTVIQEIVSRGGWSSGNGIAIFWEDFEDRSDHNPFVTRITYGYRQNAAKSPKLVVTYLPPPTPVADGDLIGIGIIRKT